jgi:hypothetical protein
MSLRGNIETYTLEQKIEGYKLFSDTSYSYRIRNRENMLVSFCQVSGSCSKEPVIFKPYFSSSEIQFKMETEFKLFSATHHLYCTTQNNFFAHIKSKIGGTWQIFFSSDSKPLNLVFSRDIIKRKVKAFNADKMVDYLLIREKKIVGGIIRDIQNEITQNNDLKENSRNNFDPTPCKLILKLKPEVLKLDLRALWAATVVLQESYKIAPLPAVHLV